MLQFHFLRIATELSYHDEGDIQILSRLTVLQHVRSMFQPTANTECQP